MFTSSPAISGPTRSSLLFQIPPFLLFLYSGSRVAFKFIECITRVHLGCKEVSICCLEVIGSNNVMSMSGLLAKSRVPSEPIATKWKPFMSQQIMLVELSMQIRVKPIPFGKQIPAVRMTQLLPTPEKPEALAQH